MGQEALRLDAGRARGWLSDGEGRSHDADGAVAVKRDRRYIVPLGQLRISLGVKRLRKAEADAHLGAATPTIDRVCSTCGARPITQIVGR